jgi:hypothetical protein
VLDNTPNWISPLFFLLSSSSLVSLSFFEVIFFGKTKKEPSTVAKIKNNFYYL